MRLVDLSGYVASLLVFLTFYMKDMVPLRVVALLSNIAFLIYGGALQLWPVILLHGALIPVNICRLAAESRTKNIRAVWPMSWLASDRGGFNIADSVISPSGESRTANCRSPHTENSRIGNEGGLSDASNSTPSIIATVRAASG